MDAKKAGRPNYWLCDESGSFAEVTFRIRLPGILQRVLDDWRGELDAHQQRALEQLYRELVSNAPVRAVKHLEWPQLPVGVCWGSLPFLHAEVYLYQQILESVGYFDRESSFFDRDVFSKQKAAARHACASLMESLKSKDGSITARVYGSYFGNKTDLSLHSLQEAKIATDGPMSLILVNDTPELVQFIDSLPSSSRVDIIVDNYCFELFNDLLLAQTLLKRGRCASVHVHCKRHPIFVSDAVRADVEELIAFCGMTDMAVVVEAHPYWSSQWEWFEGMPDDLAKSLDLSSLILVKGDANYRKLVGERHYSMDESFSKLVDYMPGRGAVCALRGLKCELVVGVPLEVCLREQQAHPEWRVDGSRGVIQFAKRQT